MVVSEIDSSSEAILYSSSTQAPRSISLHLSEQKGRNGLSSYSFCLPQVGHLTNISIVTQCLKCRNPVKTIEILCSFAAFITSSSLIDPPGWIIADMP